MTSDAGEARTAPGLVLQADWILPVNASAIPQGYLVAAAGLIEYVGAELPERFLPLPRVRLENTAILPGWVNSHCHLEFSDLDEPIPSEGTFDQWLARVMLQRASVASLSPEERLSLRQSAIRKGLLESWRCGVRWIVDNVTAPWDPAWISDWQADMRRNLPPLAATALVPEGVVSVQPCFELVDVQEKRWDQTSIFAFEQVGAPKFQGIVSQALAPHAPYTASLQVTRRVAQWSRSQRGLVSMHLAETLEELQWLDHRNGPLGDWIAPKTDAIHRLHLGTIDEHLSILASCWRTLVVHGNYLEPHQIDFLSRHRDGMAVVYCPRTHAWFHHRVHPLNQLVAQGVPVLLGTDSRASNPNLNLWGEVGCIMPNLESHASSQAIRMVSTDPAEFLDLPRGIGRIEIGGASQLTAIRWDDDDSSASGRRSEKEWMEWMVKSGNPYPLETDTRIAVGGASRGNLR